MDTAVVVRPARAEEGAVIAALMAPEIAAGNLLPRVVKPEDFLVATHGEDVVGAVGLGAWTDDVAELGSLVSAAPGRGVGVALVEAALAEAGARGYRTVVALTGIPGFFVRQGFDVARATPWARARGCETLPVSPTLDRALSAKARICAACPRLAGCQQVLLAVSVAQALRAVA